MKSSLVLIILVMLFGVVGIIAIDIYFKHEEAANKYSPKQYSLCANPTFDVETLKSIVNSSWKLNDLDNSSSQVDTNEVPQM